MVFQRTRLNKNCPTSASRYAFQRAYSNLYKNLTSKAVFIVSLVNPVFRKSLTDKYTRWKQYSKVAKLQHLTVEISILQYKNISRLFVFIARF